MKKRTPAPGTVPALRLVWNRDDDGHARRQPTKTHAPAPVNPVAHDTVAALEKLLTDARAGELIGIAFAAAYSRRSYATQVTDDLLENPTFARGMVATLDDQLRRLMDAP